MKPGYNRQSRGIYRTPPKWRPSKSSASNKVKFGVRSLEDQPQEESWEGDDRSLNEEYVDYQIAELENLYDEIEAAGHASDEAYHHE